ncbi:N-acetylmuramoyl-L-alanine amidase [uncultured Clostridium sp.]|uniref:N-acetylmuramoyl-L-alanine amidase n=1 Tax=uncultured Clostridium sp. TaxID=59620 RepID=UPI0025FF979B|nr:N-acetylmuramoyl-L-alanine amidase [uncultured Clostridium sp.]
MKIRERLASFLMALFVAFSFLPSVQVMANTLNDINIVSETEVTAAQAKSWAKSKGATETFINLADLYFEYAEECGGVNPAIAYVQAAKETGYGKFGGVLDETYHNPCGMKTSSGGGDYDKNAHQKFNSWDEGVRAHLDHLALYAGADGYPKKDTYDPRHFVTIKGKAPTVNSLGGKWAPSTTYGEEVNSLYRNLLKSAGVSIGSEEIKDDSDDNSGNNSGDSNEIIKVEPPKDTVAPQAPPVNKPAAMTNDPVNISSTIGWRFEGGSWYYYRSDGTKATGWIKPDKDWYYLYSNGMMATGWFYSGYGWYYLQPSGAMKTGWLKDGAKWYYLQGGGSMVTGFNSIDGKTYFFDVSGAMRTGWFQISGEWYYFNSDGAMLTGWIRPNGQWYYLFSNGIMAKGWLAVKGEQYYMDKNNGDMAEGWVQDSGSYYYFTPGSGSMARNTTVDGWKVGPDGKRGERVSGGSSKLIVIDPGHNFGGDDGAYGYHNGVTYSERDLNMQVAVKLKSKLEAYGYNVVMTRNESDRETLAVSQSLANRVNLANSLNADFFVSLHHNSAGSASAYGVETYYSDRSQDSSFGGSYNASKISTSKNMAAKINNAIAAKTGQYNRGAKESNLYVCRNTKMPSVLVELGFVSNPDEAAKCASWSQQDSAASAIAETIANSIK